MMESQTAQLKPLKTSAEVSTESRGCRFCGEPLEQIVVDLGLSPLCQNRIAKQDLNKFEPFYPLRAFVCEKCWLVQVHEHVSGEDIFSHYAYFSSFSSSWLEHCSLYVDSISERLNLNESSFVIELASNDGYLLQNFVRKKIKCLGIEPATNVAQKAIEKGIPVLNKFFGRETAKEALKEHGQADLMIANNVLAHVPDLNDFVGGIGLLLSETGTLTVEFPHLLNLIQQLQFDTIYQEHYCYFSLTTLCKVFEHHGMKVYDVDKIPTHGGSLRIYVCQNGESAFETSHRVADVLNEEVAAGLTELDTYRKFADEVQETKWKLLEFLIGAKRQGKTVCAYGAPGKGNTLLNYCGIREDLIQFTVDQNPFKQDHFLPGSRIPVYDPAVIRQYKPDFVLILPWNLKDEIVAEHSYVKDWGGQFVIPIPSVEVVG
ncbi:MAG: class I SAM-dependent methyltransferase [Planctomycetota bacterium]